MVVEIRAGLPLRGGGWEVVSGKGAKEADGILSFSIYWFGCWLYKFMNIESYALLNVYYTLVKKIF